MSPEREFSATRHRSPAAIINKGTKARPDTFAIEGQMGTDGPGTYKTKPAFGEGLKNMTFNKTPR